jgi:xanthine dehydrogenase molybdenum-binding subunit
MTAFAVIGKGTPKRDGPEKVTGRTRYLHDLTLPRMLHGRILRAKYPHARLVRIDASRARALPGVVAVITGEDVEQHPFGFLKDQLALKRGKVRCIRDEVVAVAAETPVLAEEALALVDVEYEALPAVFDPRQALEPGAPLVHEETGTNLTALRYQFTHGDVDRAFHDAAATVEGEFRLNFVTPACLGTMVAIADWDAQGRLTLWSTTQVPFLYQRDLAGALGISGDRVRVHQPPVGGNFGRGLDLYPIDVIAALLARQARRPVKIEFERVEEFIACPTREPCLIRLRRRPPAGPRGPRHARQRRLRVVGLDHALRDAGHGGRALPVPQRPVRHHDRLHQQPVLRLDAGLRQSRIDVRRRVPDGRPGRAAGPRSARLPPAQRGEAG